LKDARKQLEQITGGEWNWIEGVERDKGGRILTACGIAGCQFKSIKSNIKTHKAAKLQSCKAAKLQSTESMWSGFHAISIIAITKHKQQASSNDANDVFTRLALPCPSFDTNAIYATTNQNKKST